MAGRRGVGRPPTKRTSGAASAGKSTTKTASLAAAAAESLSTLVQRDRRRGRDVDAGHNKPQEEDEEEVMLVYRKPSTRHGRPPKAAAAAAPVAGSSSSGGTAGAHAQTLSSASASAPSPDVAVLQFWRRVTGHVNLARYLLHCGVRDGQQCGSHGEPHSALQLSAEQVFLCGEQRMESAVRALWSIDALVYTPASTAQAPWPGYPCWVRAAHQSAVVALAQVCEAAVPLHLPSLVNPTIRTVIEREADNAAARAAHSGKQLRSYCWSMPLAEASGEHTATSSGATDETLPGDLTTVELVPSPVLLVEVHRRLACLRRLQQLRTAYAGLLPRLHAATTALELRHLFFAHDGGACQTLGNLRSAWKRDGAHVTRTQSGLSGMASEQHRSAVSEMLASFLGSPLALDTLLPLVGLSARHPQEESLLQHLVVLLREQTTVDAATWGPMAAMVSWRCTEGVYVVQHASRVRVLRRLLTEAQFYGLPRFLRSIRVGSGVVPGAPLSSSGEEGWLRAAALSRAQGLNADQFFLTLDALDPDSFAAPDPMQAQLVQEELITLQRTHAAFCLVVGEADEVTTLVHAHVRHVGEAWMHLVKKEECNDEEERSTAVKREESGGQAAEAAVIVVESSEAGCSAGGDAAEETGGAQPYAKRRRASVDPLSPYVLETVDAARRAEQARKSSGSSPPSASSAAPALPFHHVQWIRNGSTNRWSPNTHYYGVVFMVVLETDEWETDEVSMMTEGLLPKTSITVDEGLNVELLRLPREPAYCVNAVLELWRS